jgi:putative addiction module component (TIGR02574 family)
MTHAANTILNRALELSASERADVAERLLFSLDSPDSNIDAIWAKEADARVDAYENGKVESISAEEVFEKYHRS